MADLHAFIDEAGDRSRSARSSQHFVMAGIVVADADLPAVAAIQARLRTDLGRRPGDPIHWQNLRSHSHRLHAARTVGQASELTVSSVVVCKRHLSAAPLPDEHFAYLFTFRFLLERLSWIARDRGATLDYTLAHIVRFKLAQLRAYEARLKAQPSAACKVEWANVDGHGGRIDQPNRVEQLQLADISASAIFQAFEPDQFGNTETRYLTELAPRLYRRPPGPLTSYGLKMHPWNETTKAAYPWVAAL